jgi:indolepyruvate ferredoxin oxidoreductase, alpha subunit
MDDSSAAGPVLLLGDEAVGLAALDAGLKAAYSYPGTPATEILEFIRARRRPGVVARWCVNEKSAYEHALGVSHAGCRTLVCFKHVGLNVAADPFVNSALVAVRGGLVVAVADDPGMDSSQNEQDSRWLADFARIPCLEPADPQEAYDMTREAFDLSERYGTPVMVRLVTALAHCRAPVVPASGDPSAQPSPAADPRGWILLPAHARRRWRAVLERWEALAAFSERCRWNGARPGSTGTGIGVVTCGSARTSFDEIAPELEVALAHFHVAFYPPPAQALADFAAPLETLCFLEEGVPFVERLFRGLVRPLVGLRGRLSGDLPPDGRLSPDLVRAALGVRRSAGGGGELPSGDDLPARPPRLCDGCPHTDTFDALRRVLDELGPAVTTSDIGCYTLGVLPPFSVGDSCVCMGASVGMARGAADAGLRPVLAVIGDSTFLHSGLAPLLDAVADDADLTLVILDNSATAMTGGQPTAAGSDRLRSIVAGLGVDPAHVRAAVPHPRRIEDLARLIREETEHRGLSVVLASRECVQTLRRGKEARKG